MSSIEHPKGRFDLDRAEWQTAGEVQVAFVDDLVGMRKAGQEQPVLVFNHAEWSAFLAGAKDGEFELE